VRTETDDAGCLQVGQPRRMETCGAEEPYEGNLHVRFCGGSGRVIADPTRTADTGERGPSSVGVTLYSSSVRLSSDVSAPKKAWWLLPHAEVSRQDAVQLACHPTLTRL
jgi:hypothetical protein